MSYELNKRELLVKACNFVAEKLNIEPYLVYIDMLKYIEGYYNPKIKVYVVINTTEDLELDDTFLYDGATIHVKTIKLSLLLSFRRYKVSLLLSNLTNSIAVINNKDINDLILKLINSTTPLEFLEDINYKLNSINNRLKNEKKFNIDNKIIVSRAFKFIELFSNIYTTFDILKAYEKTINSMNNDVILHLMTNKPMLEKISTIITPEEFEAKKFEEMKENISKASLQIASIIDKINENIEENAKIC